MRCSKILVFTLFAHIFPSMAHAQLTLGGSPLESSTGTYHPLPEVHRNTPTAAAPQSSRITVPDKPAVTNLGLTFELNQLAFDENYEKQWLQEHDVQVAFHYMTLAITLGGGGTEDEEGLRQLATEILAHANHLKEIRNRTCAVQKLQGLKVDCQPVALKVLRNPTYEVPKSQSTYQGGPIYVPYTPSNNGCEYSSKIGRNGCPVR